MNLADQVAVQRDGHLGTGLIHAADELGDRAGGVVGSPGVFALGAVGKEEVFTASQAGGLKNRQQFVSGRAGVGCRLEHHKLAFAQHRGDHLGAVEHKAEVGFAMRAQWRGHAQHKSIGGREALGV